MCGKHAGEADFEAHLSAHRRTSRRGQEGAHITSSCSASQGAKNLPQQVLIVEVQGFFEGIFGKYHQSFTQIAYRPTFERLTQPIRQT